MLSRIESRYGSAPEGERSQSIGVVLFVVSSSTEEDGGPRVLTVREKMAKAETGRIPGQLSLPSETRKVGEEDLENVLGALAEVTDSDEALRHLHVVPGAYYKRGAISVGGKPADVAFLIYDGPEESLGQPLDAPEIEANGWMSVSTLARLNGEVRVLTHDSIRLGISGGMLESVMQERNRAVPLMSYLKQDFSIRSFIADRDRLKDVIDPANPH